MFARTIFIGMILDTKTERAHDSPVYFRQRNLDFHMITAQLTLLVNVNCFKLYTTMGICKPETHFTVFFYHILGLIESMYAKNPQEFTHTFTALFLIYIFKY